MPVDPWLDLFRNMGVASLFLAALIVVSGYLYKELKEAKLEAKKELRDIVEKITLALERSTKGNDDTIAVLKQVQTTMEECKKQTAEFIAFQKGRDSVQ